MGRTNAVVVAANGIYRRQQHCQWVQPATGNPAHSGCCPTRKRLMAYSGGKPMCLAIRLSAGLYALTEDALVYTGGLRNQLRRINCFVHFLDGDRSCCAGRCAAAAGAYPVGVWQPQTIIADTRPLPPKVCHRERMTLLSGCMIRPILCVGGRRFSFTA